MHTVTRLVICSIYSTHLLFSIEESTESFLSKITTPGVCEGFCFVANVKSLPNVPYITKKKRKILLINKTKKYLI